VDLHKENESVKELINSINVSSINFGPLENLSDENVDNVDD